MAPEIRLPYPHPGQIVVRQQARRFNRLRAGRRWRKTTLCMSICVESALEDKKLIWGSPTFAQSRIGFEETRTAAGGYADFNETRMEVKFPHAGMILFGSLDNPDHLRGFTADGVVMDEAPMAKRRAWNEILLPMLVDTKGWAWWIYTPKGRDWVWEEDMRSAGEPDCMTWQIPTLGVEITPSGLVRKPHPLENPFVTFEEIERQYRAMPERIFRQEFMAEYIDLEGGVFRHVMECANSTPIAQPAPGCQYIAAVDVASSVDYTVVSVMDVASKSLVYLDRFNRVDANTLEDRLHATYKQFKLSAMTVEQNGIGMMVIDHLRNRDMAIIPFLTTNATKQAIITSLQGAFEHGEISILNDPILVNELLSFEAKRNASGSFSYSAPEGLHDDCVMSLAMAWDAVGVSPFGGIHV